MRNLHSAVLSALTIPVTPNSPICFVDSTGIQACVFRWTDVDLIATSLRRTKVSGFIGGEFRVIFVDEAVETARSHVVWSGTPVRG